MSYLEYLRDRCADMLAEMWTDPRILYTRREMLEVLGVEEYAAMMAWLRPINAERAAIISEQHGGTSVLDLPDTVRRYQENLHFAQKMTEWFDRHIPNVEPLSVQGQSMAAQRAAFAASTAQGWSDLSPRDRLFFGQPKPLLQSATDYPGLLMYRDEQPVFELAVFGDFAWQRACILAIEAKLESINEQLGL